MPERFELPDRPCLHRGRCGKPKDGHEVHVQYDVGGQILETWRDKPPQKD